MRTTALLLKHFWWRSHQTSALDGIITRFPRPTAGVQVPAHTACCVWARLVFVCLLFTPLARRSPSSLWQTTRPHSGDCWVTRSCCCSRPSYSWPDCSNRTMLSLLGVRSIWTSGSSIAIQLPNKVWLCWGPNRISASHPISTAKDRTQCLHFIYRQDVWNSYKNIIMFIFWVCRTISSLCQSKAKSETNTYTWLWSNNIFC